MSGSGHKVNGKSHYERNKDVYKRDREHRRIKARMFLMRVKRRASCKDCGQTDGRVLQFDHVRGQKEIDLAWAPSQGWSIARMKKEIRKCDIVCANCHILRTHYSGRGFDSP